MAQVAEKSGVGAKILCLGLGGGTLHNYLADKGFSITTCEFDQNIIDASNSLFNLSPRINVANEDARHFMRTEVNNYNVIISDLYKGEQPPEHCYTFQAFQDLYKHLEPNGVIIMNLWGYYSGAYGKGVRSIYRTLQKTGFQVFACATDTIESRSNLMLIISKPTCNQQVWDSYCKVDNSYPVALDSNMEDFELLDDSKPALDKINLPLYYLIRQYQIWGNK